MIGTALLVLSLAANVPEGDAAAAQPTPAPEAAPAAAVPAQLDPSAPSPGQGSAAPAVGAPAAVSPPTGSQAAAVVFPVEAVPVQAEEKIEGERAVSALCAAVVPTERIAFRGDAVERGRAEAEHERKRAAALARRYQVLVGGQRLAFQPYDAEEGELRLANRTSLVAAGGALRLWPLEDRNLPAQAAPAVAARIVEAQKKGQLSLALSFSLPDEEGSAPCTSVTGGKPWTLGIEPVSWSYVIGGQTVARGGEGGDRPLVSFAEGAIARVEVGSPMAPGEEKAGLALRDEVTARGTLLGDCYGEALAKNPRLDGNLAAEIGGAAVGDQTPVRFVVDSVQDPVLSACVGAVLARVPPPGGASTRVILPLRFVLEPAPEAVKPPATVAPPEGAPRPPANGAPEPGRER